MENYGYTTTNDQEDLVKANYCSPWIISFNEKMLDILVDPIKNKDLPTMILNTPDNLLRPKTDKDPF